MTATLHELADRVAQGGTLHDRDAAVIAASHDLITIGMMADAVRRQLHGSDTTFVRVFEMHVDAIPPAAPSALAAGEFRIVGTAGSIDDACSAVEAARRIAGAAYLSGFSLHELRKLYGSSASLFSDLRAAGLDAIAATPLESAAPAVIDAARKADLLVQRLVVLTPPRDVPGFVASARDLQASVGGFRAFAPLPRTMSVASPTTGYDDVKLIALARLLVREIPSIQVDWPLYGPKLAQVGLTVGADDVDGIAAVEAGVLGARRSALEEIRGNIRAAGLQPVERDGRFEVRAH